MSTRRRPYGHALTAGLLIRGLALLHAISFAHIATQVLALIGGDGIQPMTTHLGRLRDVSGGGGPELLKLYLAYPSIFWVNASDSTIWWGCVAGAGLSAQLACCGSRLVDSRVTLAALYVLLLSLCSVGGDFFAFPWDYLLAEATFLAAVLLPPLHYKQQQAGFSRLGTIREPAREAMFALQWLAFRFNLSMGVEKIPGVNGNPHWANMTYLARFYETEQPMPTALAWYAHFLPTWFHTASCLGTWALEICAPIVAVSACSRRSRHVAATLMCFLQVPIALTGNYSILNWLSVVLCIPLVDDGFFGANHKTRTDDTGSIGRNNQASHLSPLFRALVYLHASLGAILFLRTLASLDYLGNPNWLLDDEQYAASLAAELELADILSVALPITLRDVLLWGARFKICGQWGGVFHDSFLHEGKVVMVLEAGWDFTADSVTTWREIPWRYHVSDPDSAPPFIAPLFPRLDHSVFYEVNGIGFNRINPLAPLRNRGVSGAWFLQFVQRLLDGGDASVPIWALMDVGESEARSLAKHPPKYIRAKRYLYRFAEPGTSDNSWWTRTDHGVYLSKTCRGDAGDTTCARLNCVALCSYTHPEMPYEFCQENTPSICRLPGGVFRHDDPASILFELDGHIGAKSTGNVLLSHLLSEVPTSYLNALGSIFDGSSGGSDGSGRSSSGTFYSHTKVIQFFMELYEACKKMEPHERHPVCIKLL